MEAFQIVAQVAGGWLGLSIVVYALIYPWLRSTHNLDALTDRVAAAASVSPLRRRQRP